MLSDAGWRPGPLPSPCAGPVRVCRTRPRSMSSWPPRAPPARRDHGRDAHPFTRPHLRRRLDHPGDDPPHRRADRVAGGKGLNMARAARTMGASVFVVALLGGPTGRLLIDLLDAEGFELVTVDSRRRHAYLRLGQRHRHGSADRGLPGREDRADRSAGGLHRGAGRDPGRQAGLADPVRAGSARVRPVCCPTWSDSAGGSVGRWRWTPTARRSPAPSRSVRGWSRSTGRRPANWSARALDADLVEMATLDRLGHRRAGGGHRRRGRCGRVPRRGDLPSPGPARSRITSRSAAATRSSVGWWPVWTPVPISARRWQLAAGCADGERDAPRPGCLRPGRGRTARRVGPSPSNLISGFDCSGLVQRGVGELEVDGRAWLGLVCTLIGFGTLGLALTGAGLSAASTEPQSFDHHAGWASRGGLLGL